jgi:hypothetical protein
MQQTLSRRAFSTQQPLRASAVSRTRLVVEANKKVAKKTKARRGPQGRHKLVRAGTALPLRLR